MPNEVLGCPQNFQTTFLVFFLSHRLSHLQKIRSLDALRVCHHTPVTTFFSSFTFVYIHFLIKLAPWMPPMVDARGRRTVRTPSARHWLLVSFFLELVFNHCPITPRLTTAYYIFSSLLTYLACIEFVSTIQQML